MNNFQDDKRTDRETIDEAIRKKYGLPLIKWMFDLVASVRGRNGTLPIAAEKLASRLGITVSEVSQNGSFGVSRVSEQGEICVSVSTDISFVERNFTIAHEIGHVFFHRASEGVWTHGDEIEDLCDLFGAYLLAPLPFIDLCLRADGATLKTIDRIASLCQLPRSPLERIVVEHYPISAWRRRGDVFQWRGHFDLLELTPEIEKMLDSGERVLQIKHFTAGIDHWTIEASLDEEGGYGLIKPSGAKTKKAPLVRSINIPRNRLLQLEEGEWLAY